jgi:hypothetical protein
MEAFTKNPIQRVNKAIPMQLPVSATIGGHRARLGQNLIDPVHVLRR